VRAVSQFLLEYGEIVIYSQILILSFYIILKLFGFGGRFFLIILYIFEAPFFLSIILCFLLLLSGDADFCNELYGVDWHIIQCKVVKDEVYGLFMIIDYSIFLFFSVPVSLMVAFYILLRKRLGGHNGGNT